jgi:ribosome-binding factor A
MSSRRTLKAASAIREVVSMAILTELRDPRVQNVTVTGVELSGDMRSAKVYVSVMGSAKEQELCMHGLRCSAGFLQKRINDRIDTRYTPRIQFELDQGIKKSFEVAGILREVLPKSPEADADEAADDEYDDEFDDALDEEFDEDADSQDEHSEDQAGGPRAT